MKRCWSDSTDEMSKTSWKTGKLCMKGDLENHSKDQHFLLEQRLIIIRFQRDLSRIFPFGKKVPPVIFLGYELIAGIIWKWDVMRAELEDLEKLDASEIFYPRRINAKEVLITQKEYEFIFPVADGTRTHSKAGTNRKERRFQWRTSRRTRNLNQQNLQMIWSIQVDLLHLLASQWT